ncbi:hypothetical protein [Streptomyces sp. CL12-4]|uniref:hypothetical protein n=1 Tax=Streptomyces sp. CL12-4 TaxID=2810306 RepID=UPI001EFBA3C1|nr:hypothetical protein [Streptomyces sp. CL12-4]MCG8970264.1 hypothetical protein [Streptomyces sp. CL12-4]
MADEPQTTPVQERVRQRFADELTANHAEQEELTGQIAALQQRLDQLKADAAWLMQAQSSLPTTGVPADGASGSAAETPSTAPDLRADENLSHARFRPAAWLGGRAEVERVPGGRLRRRGPGGAALQARPRP